MKNSSTAHSYVKAKLLSFFTGGGFLDMGFERAGFQVVWTNEVNPVFADMHEHGMTAWHKHIGKNGTQVRISSRQNIENVSAKSILKGAFGKERRSGLIGIIGGPPCPDFSVGGKNKGHKGPNGKLTKVYVDRICSIRPDFFVFENVAGIYKTHIHRKFLTRIEKKLERKGYCLDLKVLNSLDLGVPQDRERLIMIGIRKNLVKACAGKEIKVESRAWFPWPVDSRYSNARSRFSWPMMSKFGEEPDKPSGIPEALMVDSILNGNSHPEEKPNGKDFSFEAYSRRFSTVKEGDTKRKSFKRLHRYRYSPTACYGHNEVHLHPWEKRRLTVREAMRIQGIPDQYELPEKNTLSDKFAMVSNGVPVPLAYRIALRLKKFMRNFL